MNIAINRPDPGDAQRRAANGQLLGQRTLARQTLPRHPFATGNTLAEALKRSLTEAAAQWLHIHDPLLRYHLV